MGGPYARGESETSSATARVNAERAKPAWACYAQPVRYADGENFTIDLERTVAVARVFRNPAIHGPALGAAAQSLLAVGRKLSVESGVSGMVLDLRRVPGAVGPHVEAAYGSLAGVWEATGQPFAFLVEDAVQRMQLVRLVENVAPRMWHLSAARRRAALRGRGRRRPHDVHRWGRAHALADAVAPRFPALSGRGARFLRGAGEPGR